MTGTNFTGFMSTVSQMIFHVSRRSWTRAVHTTAGWNCCLVS
jgi:hypothetical protein